MNDSILSQLNPRQREAAETIDGPLLIVAGPGSGKTRLITYRIAYLMRVAGVSPGRIAAVTFTNKAAREMKERVRDVVSYGAERLTLGTFHAFCAQVLRRDGEAIGLDRAFAIYDDADQVEMIKRGMRETDVDPKRFAPRAVQSAISGAKSQLLTAQGFAARTASYFDEVVGRVYERYESLMNQSSAADFDDLLLKTYILLSERDEVARKYRERYVHFMIDEFQDTNVAQYAIARLIAGEHRNLCAVGDPDQSIYSWRNADIRNILSFQTDFPDAKIIALEQNYRSTQTILDASSKLISSNTQRVEKNLFTRNGKGAPIAMAEGYDEEEEAQLVLREVNALTSGRGGGASGGRKYALGEIAVMYRVNAQSRALEEGCLRYGVPYQLIGGVKFYQRQEVKDLAAYLRLIANPSDDVSLVRVINRPTRGIGRRTLDELTRAARDGGTSMFDAIGGGESAEPEEPASALGGAPSASSGGGLSIASGAFTPRAARALGDFRDMILRLRAETQSSNIVELMDKTLDSTGYRRYLSDQDDGEDRLDNINEFRTAARDYLDMDAPAALTAFLESVSLVSDVDNLDEKPDSLTLITLHQAKGLEYPVVFMVGMEDGLAAPLALGGRPGEPRGRAPPVLRGHDARERAAVPDARVPARIPGGKRTKPAVQISARHPPRADSGRQGGAGRGATAQAARAPAPNADVDVVDIAIRPARRRLRLRTRLDRTPPDGDADDAVSGRRPPRAAPPIAVSAPVVVFSPAVVLAAAATGATGAQIRHGSVPAVGKARTAADTPPPLVRRAPAIPRLRHRRQSSPRLIRRRHSNPLRTRRLGLPSDRSLQGRRRREAPAAVVRQAGEGGVGRVGISRSRTEFDAMARWRDGAKGWGNGGITPPIFDSHSRAMPFHSRVLSFHSRALPRHSRESGNPDGFSQVRYPKSSTNRNQRIPSPFMGLQG